MTLYYSVNTHFSLKRQHFSNQVLYFWFFSKLRLRYTVLSFFPKDDMVQTNYSISKSTQKWDYVIQFLTFSKKPTWLKPRSLFVNLLKSEITLFSSQFSLKRQHCSNEALYFLFFSKLRLRYSVLNFLWKDNMVGTK